MTIRDQLTACRVELDELVAAIGKIDDLCERELILARARRARDSVREVINELDQQLSGYDC